ncbi:hypothetical protein [uncultured Paracoccus sp.]|uniref:hypothetical protein n=1 Tax=uncultured Paracoccus sp. TaxID=189685 RepID=UPI002619F60F|nr:hypothetical protein [uncultured Paracoccus sp.]
MSMTGIDTLAEALPGVNLRAVGMPGEASYYADTAMTTPAVEGGPVGAVVSPTVTMLATQPGNFPVLTGGMVDTADDRMTGTFSSPITPRYLVVILGFYTDAYPGAHQPTAGNGWHHTWSK